MQGNAKTAGDGNPRVVIMLKTFQKKEQFIYFLVELQGLLNKGTSPMAG